MKIGKTHLTVGAADPAKLEVKGIVNPANDMLWLGGGFSAKMRKAGGETIEQEALAKAPVEMGDAVVTGAGDLPAKKVIHAVIAGQDLVTGVATIRRAVRESLAKAEAAGCFSLAIPLLVTGTHDPEVHVVVGAIVEETVGYLVSGRHTFESIVFIDDDEDIRRLFADALMETFTRHGS